MFGTVVETIALPDVSILSWVLETSALYGRVGLDFLSARLAKYVSVRRSAQERV